MEERLAANRLISRRRFLENAVALTATSFLASRVRGQGPTTCRYIESYCNFIRLPCGLRLAYAEYGNPDGWPVFHQHGIPSCRWEPEQFREAIQALGNVRMISID